MKSTSMTAGSALDINSAIGTDSFVASTGSRLAAIGSRFLRSISGVSATQELASLDDRLLRDIGMTDADIGRTRAAATPMPLIWS